MIKINRIFLLMLIISLIFSLLEGGYLPYILFYGMFSVLVIGYLYMLIQSKLLDAEIILKEERRTAGDSIEYVTIVKCGSFLPVPYILVQNMNADTCEMDSYELVNITLLENSWIKRKVTFHKRGLYKIGSIDLKLFDLLNIFQYNKKVDTGVSIKVYPKIYRVKRFFSGGRDIYQEVNDKNSNNEDIYTTRDVRKYRDGDSLNRIHWKVSAKRGELYVRESDTISGEEYFIFTDMNMKNYEFNDFGMVEEHIADLTVSMCSHILSLGRTTKVYMNIKNPIEFRVDNSLNLNSMMEFMVNQKSDGEMEFFTFIYTNLQKLNKTNGLAIITGHVDDKIVQALINIKGSGYPVVLFNCGGEIVKEYNEQLASCGVAAFNFNEILEFKR